MEVQNAVQAADLFRNDPLFQFIIWGMLTIIGALVVAVVFLYKDNRSKDAKITEVVNTVTDAVKAMMPILSNIDARQMETLRRIEATVESGVRQSSDDVRTLASDLKSHILTIKQFGQ